MNSTQNLPFGWSCDYDVDAFRIDHANPVGGYEDIIPMHSFMC